MSRERLEWEPLPLATDAAAVRNGVIQTECTAQATEPSADTWAREFYEHDLTFAILTGPGAAEQIADRLWTVLQLEPGMRVFDQCCGDGGTALALARRGAVAVGVDISGAYIRAGLAAAEAAQLDVTLVEADASRWASEVPCDAGYNWGTGFGCFADDSRNLALLQAAARSLLPGARYLLDYYNVAGVLAGFKPRLSYERPLGERNVRIVRDSELDLLAGTLHQVWTMQAGSEPELVLPRTTTRLYLPRELCEMLGQAGFNVLSVWGDAAGQKLSLNSPRCMVLAERAAP